MLIFSCLQANVSMGFRFVYPWFQIWVFELAMELTIMTALYWALFDDRLLLSPLSKKNPIRICSTD